MSDSDTYSLAKALREPGYRASVVTTFNAYLPFYEEVILRRLVASGCRHNVVLMDARQCATALSDDSTRPRRAGVDYTLVPVAAPGAFHPKILLRLGKRKGSVFVGSHNLTVAGFGLNDELTNRFEYDTKGDKANIGTFAAVGELLRDFISASPPQVTDSIDGALETAPWLSKLHAVGEEVAVVGTRGSAASLWDQVRNRLPRGVRRVLILAPFFDQRFDLIRRIQKDLGGPEVVVGLDPDSANANPELVGELSRVRFVDARHQIPSTGKREGITPYLHAKALLFEGDDSSVLITGSANASGAAFLAPHRQRNTECVVLRQLARQDGLLDELGLRELFNAPEVSSADWNSMSARILEDSRQSGSEESVAAALIAVIDDDNFRVAGVNGASLLSARVIDIEGSDIGPASVVELDAPAILSADAAVMDSAAFLVLNDSERSRWAIVHRPASIAEHYASDARRALRQAIGSLDEDPAQLAVLLKLSEKVIFDDEAAIEKKESQLLRRAVSTSVTQPDSEPIRSLAIDATGRRATRQRRSIASGDITVLLDALIRRLGTRGAQPATPGSTVGNEEEQIGADDETDELPPEQPDFERLGAACRRKTRTLLKRMTAQLKACRENGASRRAIIQVAAVLGILRAFRVIELRDEWRRSRQRLLHERALREFFSTACPMLTVGAGAPVPAVLEQLEGEPCEELSMSLGLMIWLAWECEMDLDIAREKDGQTGVEENQWSRLQALAYLAPTSASDDHALNLATASVRETLRRGHDSDAWLRCHLAFLSDISTVASDPSACTKVDRPPKPGDIVYLAPQFEPRVRLVVDVRAGSQGLLVTVVDESVERGTKQFLLDRVERLAVPPQVARDAG